MPSNKTHKSRYKGKYGNSPHGRYLRYEGGAVPQTTRTIEYLDKMGFTATKERKKIQLRKQREQIKIQKNKKG